MHLVERIVVMLSNKTLGIGVESYKRIIDKNYYYVDKTLLIKNILDTGASVSLFTRPRRFGKTLAISTIQTFFECDTNVKGEVVDNSHYFAGMKIMEAGERYTKELGKYPVISLSLKSGKQPNFEMAYESLLDEVIKEYERHRYVLEGDALINSVKSRYRSIMERKAEPVAYAKSLEFLSV